MYQLLTNYSITDLVPIICRDLIGPGQITDRVPITDQDGPTIDHVPITNRNAF